MSNGHPAEQTTPETSAPISRIDTPLDRRRVGDISVEKFAGLTFREYRDAVEFCKLISQARNGIPPYLRGNAADCLVITTQALRWKLEPVWCMQNSYITREGALINYDNFVFAAIVMASGALKNRPRYTYAGDGDEMNCTVSATFIGETEPHEYTTPPLAQCKPPKNDKGEVRGSPLWTRDPQQQLGYFAIRNWARRYIPELLGGVYARDEFEDSTQEPQESAVPSPRLMDRLPGKIEGAGFAENVVDESLAAEARAAVEAREAKAAAGRAPTAPTEAKEWPSVQEATALAAEAGQPTGEAAAAFLSTRPEQDATTHPSTVKPPPATAAEYQPYAEHWIAATTDPLKLQSRWEAELDMRQNLRVPLATRKAIESAVKARVAELRRAKGQK